jgi:DNA-binding NarL/FixJ family response regulator
MNVSVVSGSASPAGAIRILAGDDHPLMRQGIASLIAARADMALVAEAADGLEAIECHERCQPDVTLMDLQMPKLDGTSAIQNIIKIRPSARIVVLTTYAGDVQAKRALRAGACGYLLKNAIRRELVDAILTAHAGRRYIPADIAADIGMHSLDDALSAREMDVLNQLRHGGSNKKIAAALCLTEDTIKTHMKSILSKLGATDRTQAVVIAIRRGMIQVWD